MFLPGQQDCFSPTHSLQYFRAPWVRASVVESEMVKNLPTMLETRVQSLDQEDPLEKEMATHFSILA